jgi:hypothetical protein
VREDRDEITILADFIARGREVGHFVPLSIRSLPSVAAAIERRTAGRKRLQARERAEYEAAEGA